MAKLTIDVEAPPRSLLVNVDFYDDDERQALQRVMSRRLFKTLPRTLSIATTDLCANYLYYKVRPNVRGYSTYDEVAKKWAQALVEFDGQLEFKNNSLAAIQSMDQSTGTTERVGEAIGLSVVSELHDLNQADWSRIPTTNKTKTLDFSHLVASNSRGFIHVETKGSATADSTRKSNSIYSHKSSIHEKKQQAKSEGIKGICYGTIGVIGDADDSIARCWLVDPPADPMSDPVKFRIVSRLTFISELVSYLGARSVLAGSLRTRLAALQAIADINQLDGVPLLRGNGTEFPDEIFNRGPNLSHNSWMAGKSVVADGPVGGHVFPINAQRLLFIGMREELLLLAAQQDFSSLAEFSFEADSIQKSVKCLVSLGRFKSEFMEIVPPDYRVANGTYISFTLSGILNYARSGFVFGVLQIPEDWQVNSQ